MKEKLSKFLYKLLFVVKTPDRVKSHEGGTGSDGRRNNKEWYKTLYVAHARKEDSGTYTCKVRAKYL